MLVEVKINQTFFVEVYNTTIEQEACLTACEAALKYIAMGQVDAGVVKGDIIPDIVVNFYDNTSFEVEEKG